MTPSEKLALVRLPESASSDHDFLSGGGEMGALIRVLSRL